MDFPGPFHAMTGALVHDLKLYRPKRRHINGVVTARRPPVARSAPRTVGFHELAHEPGQMQDVDGKIGAWPKKRGWLTFRELYRETRNGRKVLRAIIHCSGCDKTHRMDLNTYRSQGPVSCSACYHKERYRKGNQAVVIGDRRIDNVKLTDRSPQ